jgi:hypothetical protein
LIIGIYERFLIAANYANKETTVGRNSGGKNVGSRIEKEAWRKEEEVKLDESLEERKECEHGVRRDTKMTHEKKKEGNIKEEVKHTKR